MFLVCAFAFEYDLARLEDELDIFAELSVATDVVIVQTHLPFE